MSFSSPSDGKKEGPGEWVGQVMCIITVLVVRININCAALDIVTTTFIFELWDAGGSAAASKVAAARGP